MLFQKKDKVEKKADIAEIGPQVRVGGKVQFGRYPQKKKAPEPIVWRVLDITDGNALLITDDLLDAHRFDARRNKWERCEIRDWLNKDFLERAFNADEQQKLVEMEGDKISILTVDEAKKYFTDEEQEYKDSHVHPDRMAKPTAYAEKNGAYVDEDWKTGWYWLRSPDDTFVEANVTHTGHITAKGSDVSSGGNCARPIILVKLG